MTSLERVTTAFLVIGGAVSVRCLGQSPDAAHDTLAADICRQTTERDTMIVKGDTVIAVRMCAPLRWWMYHANPHPHSAPSPRPKHKVT